MKIRTIVVALVCASILFPDSGFCKAGRRLSVLPVFFVPNDSSLSDRDLEQYSQLLTAHLRLAQKHYQTLLRTDTFAIADVLPRIYRAASPAAYYTGTNKDDGTDSAHRILRELFAWNGDDRMTSGTVYLVVFARAGAGDGSFEKGSLGGGRTFNGPPGSGGGYVEMELGSLLADKPYPFQSTLVHELGHAFGMAHADCYGYDLSANDSIMSYRTAHYSKGLKQSRTPGGLNPEDYAVLSLNEPAFPNFTFDAARHNPMGRDLGNIDRCFLGRMDDTIGPVRMVEGIGFELFMDGKKVNGPTAAFYTRPQAEQSCQWNREHAAVGVTVECNYNGKRLVISP